MKNWSVLEKVLAAVAVVVFLGVAILGVVAWRSDDGEALPDGCEGSSHESDIEADASPVDALRVFVQSRTDFPIDDSWVLESDTDGNYVFVSDEGGHFEVEISSGLVRRYMKCPDG